ncbi:MAG TPA: hypothetical protein VMD75_11080 [Candidatus Binataceae bacterium]|nr:hypothetical protein [Candidatus Binataceae bacterium]
MDHTSPQSQTRNASTETVLERLYDREGLRRLSIIQRNLFQKLRRSEIDQLKVLRDDRERELKLRRLDNLMTVIDKVVDPDGADAESDSKRGLDNA